MAIQVNRLVDFDGHYENNDSRGRFLAHAGCDYFSLCLFLQEEKRKAQGAWLMYVELPMMHQTLELFAKGIAAMADLTTAPKDHGHNVLKVMQRYQHLSQAFAKIIKDPAKVHVIGELEKAYLGVRYGESGFQTDGDDIKLFNDMVDEMMEELRRRTGLRLPIWEMGN